MNITYQHISSLRGIERKPYCEKAYLTYVNDFISLACFAEWINATEIQALQIIKEGKHWHELPAIEAI